MSTTPHSRSPRPAPVLVGRSDAIRRLDAQIDALAARSCTVLLLGESGTGKELAARLIHARSPRAGRPFVPVDCTTLRDTLLESQLFGHTRGAFTGADRTTLGFFRAADGGTLFLDEIGELPLPSQAKLLRCIQERAVVPLGATAGVPVDVRVIAATHRDLRAMVRKGEFREDLFYRLNVAAVPLPPLRDRMEDVPLLARHALDDLARLYDEAPRVLTDAAIEALTRYPWPGNVRELVNAIEHALVFSPPDRCLDVIDLPTELRSARPESIADQSFTLMTLAEAERRLIAAALKATGGNQSRAAETLAIERHRLRRRILHYNLTHLVRPSMPQA